MNISPLQLENYFVTDLRVTVNSKFDPKKDHDFHDKHIVIDVDCIPLAEENRRWQVSLKVQQQSPADANVPYSFSVDVIGLFLVLEGYPDERMERLVRTNGPTMLYGIVREVVRDITARGPFLPVLLPSASFYEAKKNNIEQPTEQGMVESKSK